MYFKYTWWMLSNYNKIRYVLRSYKLSMPSWCHFSNYKMHGFNNIYVFPIGKCTWLWHGMYFLRRLHSNCWFSGWNTIDFVKTVSFLIWKITCARSEQLFRSWNVLYFVTIADMCYIYYKIRYVLRSKQLYMYSKC